MAAPATPDVLTSLHQVGARGGGQRAYGDRCQAVDNTRTTGDNLAYATLEKWKVVRQRRPTENLAYALRTRVPEMSPNRHQ